ncbi:sugar ABC transporter permease [Paenibacillus thiaminolyticus]|uniref:carbohydrate ABC transporter permease n=1 Tax=Paenibacillus thiaminolyticus TaxID=49283 RepID=UPI0023508423|nr:sugar ABC transporter permease [Paenibacillus thiaminolyticus]WCR24674.1 sugar ABC transporter permease [Paenibacillus thiaminolyticus]
MGMRDETFTHSLPAGQEAAQAAPARSRRSRRQRRESWKDLSFALPALGFLAVFLYYPLLNSIYISMTNWNMTRPTKQFVGANNYVWLLNNEDFYHSLKVTLLYTVMDVAGTLGVSMVVAAMVFTWIYNGQYGLLNSLLNAFGFDSVGWLVEPSTALPALVAVSVWKGVGFAMILFIAGIRGIPMEYYEAAAIDGADRVRQFWHITLPLLSPMTLFLLITTFISSMQVFQSIDIMTNGGPLKATNAIVYWIYTMAFVDFKTGRAMALVMVMFVIILALALLQWWASRKKVHYEG